MMFEGAIFIAKSSLMNGVIKAISRLIDKLTTNEMARKYPSVASVLAKLDISNAANAIQALLEDLEMCKDRLPTCIQVGLQGVEETTFNVHTRLSVVNAKIEKHGLKWFHSLRDPGVLEDLVVLDQLTYQLNKRLIILQQIVTIAACAGLRKNNKPTKKLEDTPGQKLAKSELKAVQYNQY